MTNNHGVRANFHIADRPLAAADAGEPIGFVIVALIQTLCVAGQIFGGDGIAFISNLKGDVAIDGNARPALSLASA